MKNLLRNRCPVCRSTDLTNPRGWIPLLYAMEPFVCNSCGARLETNIVTRTGLWLFMTALIVPMLAWPYLPARYHAGSLIFSIGIVGFVVLGAVIGGVVGLFRPWQFTVWDSRHRRRAAVNYGALASIVLYGAILAYEIGRGF
jgi:hypothetical protein